MLIKEVQLSETGNPCQKLLLYVRIEAKASVRKKTIGCFYRLLKQRKCLGDDKVTPTNK